MRACLLHAPAPIDTNPLLCSEIAAPEPAAGEVLVRVQACAVCRTDLHVIEGELACRKSPLIPGHQVVGRVQRAGAGASRFKPGDRVGIAWLHRACGVCEYCASGRENLCDQPEFTGWTVDGGFAEYAVVPESFAYRIPDAFADLDAAPLLCAGISIWRWNSAPRGPAPLPPHHPPGSTAPSCLPLPASCFPPPFTRSKRGPQRGQPHPAGRRA
jgi:propanol-preferring alcohol dehydrogenase